MGKILPLITALLGLLKGNNGTNERKNLRIVKRTYKKLKKEYAKDGLDADEIESLSKLKKAIVKRTLELG